MARTEILSICVPTYNRSAHVAELIRALKKQMGKLPKTSVKVYISDNCSHDDTQERVLKLIKNDSRFQYRRNESNLGMMGNFLRVLNLAKGDYLWLFGDDDEFCRSDSLRQILHLIRKHQPAYLTLQPSAFSKETASISFQSANEYISHFAGKNPYALLASTWITANIIRRDSFDAVFAADQFKTFYMHMYGIMKGLKNNDGAIFVETSELVRPCITMGEREASFPELEPKWLQYFNYLSKEFAQPSLRHYAKRWKKSWHLQVKIFVLNKMIKNSFTRKLKRAIFS